MPREVVTRLLDDLDGKELPDDTQPINLSLGRTTYALYLSEDNHGKLLEALDPFIKTAEKVDARSSATAAPRATRKAAAASQTDADGWTKEEKANARAWAIATGYKFTNAAGEEKTLGERGRIPDVVMKAWTTAGSPGSEEATD